MRKISWRGAEYDPKERSKKVAKHTVEGIYRGVKHLIDLPSKKVRV
jgi:hypothetical protein|tara:strand:+ start:586 stop:723 length:138 start_codon:yes stop_codon:yes gene_type:complete